MTQLLLATRNAGKLAELQRLLASAVPGVEVLGLRDVPEYPEAPETGATFEENALLKARAIARFTGLPAVADDSGICVSVLNDMPGAFSARWAGRHGDDQANLELLLGQLAEIAPGHRAARFTCAAALVIPDSGGPDPAAGDAGGTERVVEGRLDGRLTEAPRGTHGFGYDPIFVPEGHERTTAEMTPDEKDAISHRGRAFRALAKVLAGLLAGDR
jgi:XTP/dITP diphosphohydrolase